jgi:hypothetical protein
VGDSSPHTVTGGYPFGSDAAGGAKLGRLSVALIEGPQVSWI